jgi:hypothetical protein
MTLKIKEGIKGRDEPKLPPKELDKKVADTSFD